jgi:hypothetical protein
MPQYRLVPTVTKPGVIPPPVISDLTLWQVFHSPPSYKSVLISSDGTVTAAQAPLNEDIKAATVFIPGGHQFITEENSFAYNSLVAAGYTLEAVV